MARDSEVVDPQAGARARVAGRRVAVTGAGGFIGGAVCRSLAAAGAEVSGIDADPDAAQRIRGAGAAPAFADVTDRGAMLAALEGSELLVHTAAIVSDAGRMEDHVRINVGGTAAVLDAAAAAGTERRVHVSSVVVYGYDDPSEQDESAHLRTCGVPYIDTKSASDRLARRRGAVVLRPGDVYGPRSIPWAVRPLELARAGQLGVPGQGDGLMLPVYIDDLVDSVVLLLSRGEPGDAYTAWKDDETVTFEQFFNRIAAIAGGRPARRVPRPLLRSLGMAMEGSARITGGAPRITRHSATLIDRRGSVSAAKLRSLGWNPQVGLEEGMRRTEEWFRSEGLL
jgi:nucleoside-diphosphate-sugar epimerase